MAKTNLIYLVYSSLPSQVEIVEKQPRDIVIDFENKTWTHLRTEETMSIGVAVKIPKYEERFGTIAVLDRNNLNHLNLLITIAKAAVADIFPFNFNF